MRGLLIVGFGPEGRIAVSNHKTGKDGLS